MPFYPESYKFGKQQESLILPRLRNYFSRDIQQSEDRYAKHDYFDEEFNYELKSRKNKMSAFQDTIVPADKITGEKPLILLFGFTDKLAFIHFNEEEFKSFPQKIFGRNGLDQKPYYYIPIDKLKVID